MVFGDSIEMRTRFHRNQPHFLLFVGAHLQHSFQSSNVLEFFDPEP